MLSRPVLTRQSVSRITLRRRYAPVSHFLTKLAFAAPDSFFPSLPIALSSQHFFMKAVFAAPARGFPSLPTALAGQLSCAMAGPTANADTSKANKKRFMCIVLQKVAGAQCIIVILPAIRKWLLRLSGGRLFGKGGS